MSKRRRPREARTPGPKGGEPVRVAAQDTWPRRAALAALLCSVTAFSYWPALHGGFIWDDKVLLTDNAMIRAADGVRRFWLTTEAYDYWPLTSTTYWVEWRLFALDPFGYHVTNLVLHAAEAILLWAILARLRIGGAFLAALLFAVHPVNVESVAWIAQRKNLVAMLFLELALLFYLWSDPDETPPDEPRTGDWNRWYWLSVAAFLLAMLGKGSAAVLPLILLLVAWWRRARVGVRDLKRVAPFFPLAAGMVLVNIWFQTHGNGPIREATLVERLLGAGTVVWFYLAKALLPLRLAFIYPEWHIDPRRAVWWVPLAAAIAVSVLLWHRRGTWGRAPLAAWLLFCIGLLPVMGFTDVYFMKYSLVADHYQHLAIVAVVTLVSAAWSAWARGPARLPALALAAAVVALLALLTRQQSALYQDEETLYVATLQANPGCWLCEYNLGRLLDDGGRRPEALAHYERAVGMKPSLTEARVNLGLMLDEEGRHDDALRQLQEAVHAAPGSWRAHYNLGLVLAGAGRPREAVQQYEEVLRLRPGDPETHTALGSAWQELGDPGKARSEFESALRVDPSSAQAHFALGLNLARGGRLAEAIAQLEEALRLRPDDPELHYNAAILLTDASRRAEAVAHYERALAARPGYAEAHNNLAILLAEDGRVEDAIAHYEQAARARPDYIDARMNLAETLVHLGRLPEALAQARAALAATQATGQRDWEQKVRAWLARHGER